MLGKEDSGHKKYRGKKVKDKRKRGIRKYEEDARERDKKENGTE